MNEYQQKLYKNLMDLCNSSDSFYYVDYFLNENLFRTFTYRLASYTDFLKESALECRGHTFNISKERIELVSLPMNKFFNLNENPLTMNLNLHQTIKIMDKLDGSMISTVKTPIGTILKSKTSFTSFQALRAMELYNSFDYRDIKNKIEELVNNNYTVNFEFCGPDNRIVLGYTNSFLKILNIRNNINGEYLDEKLYFNNENIVGTYYNIPDNMEQFINSIDDVTGIEGFVIKLKDGTLFKIKCPWYLTLHRVRDSINSPRKLWEACVSETADDLRTLFKDDPISIAKILDMEVKAAKVYNHIHKTVHEFYEANKGLDRKSFAILAQKELNPEGLFSLSMNLYIGKSADVKSFMVKNYKKYGISDEEVIEDNE